jgi:cytochrome c-type biogenesis protein CcmH
MRRAAWLLLALVLTGALFIGTRSHGARTVNQRAHHIAKQVRCPTCEGLSVDESDAAASRAIRDDIRHRVEQGQTDGEIRAYLVSRFGSEILLKPSSSGIGALVWALPVVLIVCVVAGLASRVHSLRIPGAMYSRALAVGAFAVLAGVLVARGAGTRQPDQPATGSVAMSDLAVAREQVGKGDVLEAIKTYDRVLKRDPKQPEALTYRGWLIRLTGKEANQPDLVDRGLVSIQQAIAADPTYPDAHMFRGLILFQDKNDAAGAVPELRTFLAHNPPQAMVPMVEGVLKQALAASGQPAG